MNSIEDIKIDALKSNEYYSQALKKVKDNIKSKILSMQTKEEKLMYIQEEKARYMLLRDINNSYMGITLVVAVCSLLSVILLNLLKDNIIFLVLWILAITILLGAVITSIMLNINGKKIKYTIFIMAYEEIENRLKNGTDISGTEAAMAKRIDTLKDSMDVIEEQLKMIYVLQKESRKKK